MGKEDALQLAVMAAAVKMKVRALSPDRRGPDPSRNRIELLLCRCKWILSRTVLADKNKL